MMKKSIAEMKTDIVNFYKTAFCVDGDVKILPPSQTESFQPLGTIIELNDSERGKFFIGYFEEKK